MKLHKGIKTMDRITAITEFAADTLKGLSSSPKSLSSKYFYDTGGSKIFEDIMRMPEYYLTDCEAEIFERHKQDITKEFSTTGKGLELIELGAGDGYKTKILLSHMMMQNIDFAFIPIDISESAVHKLQLDLCRNLPGLKVEGLHGDYFKLISGLDGVRPKVVLFLGSNIGNFSYSESLSFLEQLHSILNEGDKMLIGFDLIKDPEIILKAYNDPNGYTAAFNLNLLCRINDELDANFNTDHFFHREIYDPQTGAAKSYLISEKKQTVHIRQLDQTFHFMKEEKIFMEISQKYDIPMIEDLADKSGFEIITHLYDSRKWFVDSLWRVKS